MHRQPSLVRVLLQMVIVALAGLLSAVSTQVHAQSAACNANEDVVTFNFAGAASTTANGTSATWTAGSLVNTYTVGSAGSVTSNTITLAITANPARAPFVSPDPSLVQQGNVNNTLSLNMSPTAPNDGVTMTLSFARSMNKVTFNMYDVDRQNPNWQDRMRIAGYFNGSATPIPALAPNLPANFTIVPAGEYNQITSNLNSNCSATETDCNVRIDFANPVDRVVLAFVAGPNIPAPTAQRVAFNRFSYCVPKRDLRIKKDAAPTPLVAGTTATYTLTINNLGNAATTGNTSISDVISTPGVSFANPQTPPGWTCTLAATSYANDTANCARATAIPARSSVTLTLTVAITADAPVTNVVNRVKVFGGGDPNKLTLTSTGPLSDCTQANENLSGGCAFESTALTKRALLTVGKTNNTATVPAGATTTYTLTFANLGPSSAAGTVASDPSTAGLNCTSVDFTSAPAGAITASGVTVTALQSTGISLTPTFPPNSTASFVVTCGVTASGT